MVKESTLLNYLRICNICGTNKTSRWYKHDDGVICMKCYLKKHYYKYELKNRHTKIRIELLQLLGNKCVRCGFTDSRALQFDHINDDGYIDKINYKSNRGIIIFYYKNPEMAKQRLQIMCANCNWIKRFECNKHNQYSK